MRLGVRDQGCRKCWNLEDKGQISMRQSVNVSRRHCLIDDNAALRQVKLITGKTCNLSCMMCFSTVSSTYHKLWESDKLWIMPEKRQKDLGYDWNMDQYIRDHAHELEYIEVLGGEPLFSKDFFDLVHHLTCTGKSQHMTMFVITNGSIMTDAMIEMFKKFKKTVFMVSIDGVGLVNDYQRWPSRWQQIELNLLKLSNEFDVSVMPTVTALNLPYLHDLYQYCEDKNLVINNFSLVDDWPALLPINLPEKIKQKVDPRFDKLINSSGDTSVLVDFIKRWDKQRGISIVDYMPEWKNFL